MTQPDWGALEAAASTARANAYAPWSSFAVGAAVETADGRVFAGCNVENATFGLTVCAERSAVVASVAAGARELRACLVLADHTPPARPCGPCLQTLAEFAGGDLPVRLVNLSGAIETVRLSDLLPQPFKGDWGHQTNSAR